MKRPKKREGIITERKKHIPNRIVYPVLDNALDFILYAAEHVGQDSPRSWKYAILHLIAGIELLLKSRLELDHWSLVFQEIDKANKNSFESGDFRSADFESLLNRLGRISSVSITKQDQDQLRRLKKIRNMLEHFSIDIDLTQVKSLMAKGLSFAVTFYENHLKDEVSDSESSVIGNIISHLHEFEEFVSERLESIRPRIGEYSIVRDCPKCSQDTLVVQDDAILHCYFCEFEINATTLAEQRTELEVDICPECGYEALAFIIYNNDAAGYECMACGQEFDELHLCGSCGNLYEGDGVICSQCMDAMVERD